LTATPGANLEVLKWTDGTTTNSTVSIERSTDGANWTVIGSVNHGVQTYTNSPVTEGATYYYRIRNYDSAVTPPTYSAYSSALSVTVSPAAPTNVEVVFSPSPTLVAKVLWVNNSTSDTAYEVDRSADGGTTWTTLTTTLPANSTSYSDKTVTSGQAYEYRVKALLNALPSTAVTTLSETASALPAPYAHGDIGDAATVGLAGSASYDSATGTYTLVGAGKDIWNAADGFQFAYTTLTGDSQMKTRVTSLTNTDAWAKAGLMYRNGTGVDAPFADVVATPGNSSCWRLTPVCQL
jgi:titin